MNKTNNSERSAEQQQENHNWYPGANLDIKPNPDVFNEEELNAIEKRRREQQEARLIMVNELIGLNELNIADLANANPHRLEGLINAAGFELLHLIHLDNVQSREIKTLQQKEAELEQSIKSAVSTDYLVSLLVKRHHIQVEIEQTEEERLETIGWQDVITRKIVMSKCCLDN